MTISLEEHVARGKREDKLSKRFKRWMDGDDEFAGRWDFNKILRALQRLERIDRAAIAAVREREGATLQGVCNKCGYCGPVSDKGLHDRCSYAAVILEPPDPAEAMRAKCDCARYEYCDVCWPKDKLAALKDNGDRK